MSIVDGALIIDNSEGKHELIARKRADQKIEIFNEEKIYSLKQHV